MLISVQTERHFRRVLRIAELRESLLPGPHKAAPADKILSQVAWSPDSRFVAVGGEDDLITLFSTRESRVVARCQGHTAFVTCIAFDYTRSGGYRFGSVGEDGKLVLVRLHLKPQSTMFIADGQKS
jgi:WD40 repeat protein